MWALGCMLYAFLTGHPPFHTQTVTRTLSRVVMGDYTMPAHLSPSAQDLIGQLLRKDPAQRPSLSAVLEHPFMTGGGGPNRSLANQTQGAGSGVSMDSGIATLSASSANPPTSSRLHRKAKHLIGGPALPNRMAPVSAQSRPPPPGDRTNQEAPWLPPATGGRSSRAERREAGSGDGGQPMGRFLRRAHSSDRHVPSAPTGLQRCQSDEMLPALGRSTAGYHGYSDLRPPPSPPVKDSSPRCVEDTSSGILGSI